MKSIFTAFTVAVMFSSHAFAADYRCQVSATKGNRSICQGAMVLGDPDQSSIPFAWLPCQGEFNASQILLMKDEGGYTAVLKVWKNERMSIGQSLAFFEGNKPASFFLQHDSNSRTVAVMCSLTGH